MDAARRKRVQLAGAGVADGAGGFAAGASEEDELAPSDAEVPGAPEVLTSALEAPVGFSAEAALVASADLALPLAA